MHATPALQPVPLRYASRILARIYYYKLREWFITPILINALLNLWAKFACDRVQCVAGKVRIFLEQNRFTPLRLPL